MSSQKTLHFFQYDLLGIFSEWRGIEQINLQNILSVLKLLTVQDAFSFRISRFTCEKVPISIHR